MEYKDWVIEEIANSIREQLEEARKPLPKKITKHFITIRNIVGEGRYIYNCANEWMWMHDDFTTVDEAVDFINRKEWLERIGENMWVDTMCYDTYIDKDGNTIPNHYEIHEYDAEVYEDGECHTEYTEDEIKDLSEALYHIEKARVYMRNYDNAYSHWCFGNGCFHNKLSEELDKFEKEYTENLPEDYYD